MLDRVLKIVNLALAAAAVFLGVEIFYQAVEYRLDREVIFGRADTSFSRQHSKAAKNAPGPAEDLRFRDYRIIAQRNLFDTAGEEKKEEEDIRESELENLEKTSLDLKLWGTIAGKDGNRSYAVIEDESERSQQLYRTGDTIGEARVKIILRKKVVLDVNGRDEILEIQEDIGKSASARTSRGRQGASESGDDSETTIDITRDQITSALQDVNSLMRQVRLRPYFEDGEPGGIMLSGIRSGSIFEEMGLESGDIIKNANGKNIRSMDDAMQFYDNLSSDNEIELEIQRDGSRRTINYQIN